MLGLLVAACGGYFALGEPFANPISVASTTATITGQRTSLGAWPVSPYSNTPYRTYFESYSFVDGAGRTMTGEDEVSAQFFSAHPSGTAAPVYYGADGSALGLASRLDLPRRQLDDRLGLVLTASGIMLIGLAVGAGRLWRRPVTLS